MVVYVVWFLCGIFICLFGLVIFILVVLRLRFIVWLRLVIWIWRTFGLLLLMILIFGVVINGCAVRAGLRELAGLRLVRLLWLCMRI